MDLGSEYMSLMLADERRFKSALRVSNNVFIQICEYINDEIEIIPNLSSEVSVAKKLALCLYLLNCPTSYYSIPFMFEVTEDSLKVYFQEVINAINKVMTPEVIKMPHHTECTLIADKFKSKCRLPQIIGCIDNIHLQVNVPRSVENRDIYLNKKGQATIILQAVVDASGK